MQDRRSGSPYAAVIERDAQDICPAFLNERRTGRLVAAGRDENGFFRLGNPFGAAAGDCMASQAEGLMVNPSTF